MTITIMSYQHHLGKAFCYYGYFNLIYAISYSQLQSFFVAWFRYLCIVHNNSLASIQITAKVILAFYSANIDSYLKYGSLPRNL
jgi:hypothetical protein